MKYLFLFTISPVQTFISQARKTQDLFGGSQILSDLVGYAMDSLETDQNINSTNFIFPIDSKATSKPNRFICLIDCEEEKVQSIGDELKFKVMTEFVEGEKFGKSINDIYNCKEQLNDFLKIYWTATEVQQDEQGNVIDYSKNYEEIEQILGSVKNIRHFNQLAEKGRKCSINGEYNVKFYSLSDSDKENAIRRIGKKNIDIEEIKIDIQNNKLFNTQNKVFYFSDKSLLKQGEGLCAVSFLKRTYLNEEFESTANIALMRSLTQIAQIEKGEKALNEFAFCFKKDNWKKIKNGQLFFEENLNEDYFKSQGINLNFLECAIEKQSIISSIAKQGKIKFDTAKYYAILVFDADSMGKILGKSTSMKEHQKVSELLGNFAELARLHIDNNNLGRTVYAGGDDFLGFLNLDNLFETVKELRIMFEDKVNAWLKGKDENDKEYDYSHLELTFTAGISVAHYKTPLSEVLTWARTMEKEAKKIDGDVNTDSYEKEYINFKKKNAIGIAVLKRSGEIHKTIWKWQYEDLWVSDVAQSLIYHLLNDNLSRKFINSLSRTFDYLIDTDGSLKAGKNFDGILSSEIHRFIARQTKEDNSKEQLELLGTQLYFLYKQSKKQNRGTLKNFIDFLYICEFINRNIKY